jgi:hypothetical protein
MRFWMVPGVQAPCVKSVCVVEMSCWIFPPRKAAIAGVVVKNALVRGCDKKVCRL